MGLSKEMRAKYPTEKEFKSEDQLSAGIFRWFDEFYPNLRGAYVLNFNNPKDKRQGNMLLAQGLRAGHPDATIFVPIFSKRIAGLHLEYKMSVKGRLSPRQIRQHKLLTHLGYAVRVVTSLKQAKEIITKYIQLWQEEEDQRAQSSKQ